MIETAGLDWLLRLEEDLVRDEGEVLHAYQDSLGYWTIGVGQNIDARAGGGISRAASRFMLRESIEKIGAALEARVSCWETLSEARRRVLMNMAFNLGVAGLLGFKSMFTALQGGRYEVAASEMLTSKWALQVGARADRLAQMMREG